MWKEDSLLLKTNSQSIRECQEQFLAYSEKSRHGLEGRALLLTTFLGTATTCLWRKNKRRCHSNTVLKQQGYFLPIWWSLCWSGAFFFWHYQPLCLIRNESCVPAKFASTFLCFLFSPLGNEVKSIHLTT